MSREVTGAMRIDRDLTIYTAAEMKQPLLAAAAAPDVEALDLSSVPEIDSAGVQLLLLARREAASGGRALRFEHPSGAVAEVLALLGISAAPGTGRAAR